MHSYNYNFNPAWWLPGPHQQTIWPSLMRRDPKLKLRWQRLDLWDGDFVDLVWADDNLAKDAPLVILLHGLNGGIDSSYAKGLLGAFNAAGWRGLLMHFRGCSGEPNRLDRSYHSGETQDFDFLIHWLKQQQPNTLLAAVGISLGGNVLLKWLGENSHNQLLTAAVAVSVPFVLSISANHLMKGFSSLYQRYFIKELHTNMKQKFANRKAPFDLKKLDQWQSFWTFDHNVTAPLHGFRDVHDYYNTASSRQYLKQITTPTLIIHAKDDPFMTPDIIPTADELSSAINFELSEQGGHVGFISGKIPGKAEYWLEQRIPEFLKSQGID